MSQPVANDPYFYLSGTAAGTVSVLNRAGNFNTYTVGTTTTGTVTLYDSSGTTEGTPGAGYMASYTGGTINSTPFIHVKHGILAVVSGTISALVGCG